MFTIAPQFTLTIEFTSDVDNSSTIKGASSPTPTLFTSKPTLPDIGSDARTEGSVVAKKVSWKGRGGGGGEVGKRSSRRVSAAAASRYVMDKARRRGSKANL